MTKDTVKNKSCCKKSYISPNMDFEAYLKNQQNIMCQLKTELKDAICKGQLLDSQIAEKNKCIIELEECVKEREEEIQRMNTNSEEIKEENKKILLEFNSFKEKFYQLEIDYDRSLQQLKQDNENLLEELEKQKAIENQKIQELSSNCCELQQRLQDYVQELAQLKEQNLETLHNFETMKKDLEKQTNDYEMFKNQVNEEKSMSNEKMDRDFNKLKIELARKDEIIKQSMLDKDLLEKEKNLIIDELNNKIYRIERAFSQPTKVVQPMGTINQQDISKNDNSVAGSIIDNLAITKPQIQKPLDNLFMDNLTNENKKSDNISKRNYKFKRPIQPRTSEQINTDIATTNNNRKLRNQPLRQSAVTYYNNFSLSSSDDDNSNNDDSCLQNLWRPNKCNDECYIPDTDTSEGFSKPKRLKK